VKPNRSLHKLDEERMLPWENPGLYAAHLARYRFAGRSAAGRTVLDVGSGEGYGAAALAEQAEKVLGVDYSPVAVEHAREKYRLPNLSFEVGDALNLDRHLLGGFDLVTCFEVLEHVEDGDRLMAGLAAALRPGGLLYLSTPNLLVDSLFEAAGGHDPNAYHVNLMSPGELQDLAARHLVEAAVYGQHLRGNAVHAALKALDFANLRHRLVRSREAQHRLATGLMGQSAAPSEAEFRFSRRLTRQAPQLLLVARAR
jgi:2-polyprenyl-3-methyl-5-hydroxy-6-metoxy-1,4-benzoquinol methylase